MVYERCSKTYDFRKFKTTPAFGNEIRNDIINMSMANYEHDQLSEHIRKFNRKTRPQNSESKKVKEDVLSVAMALIKGRKMAFKAFKS